MKHFFAILVIVSLSFVPSSAFAQSHEGRYLGWGHRASFFAQHALKGDVSKIEVEYRDGRLYVGNVTLFNERGDMTLSKYYNSAGLLTDQIEISYNYDKGVAVETHTSSNGVTDESTYDLDAFDYEYLDLYAMEDEALVDRRYDSEGRVIEYVGIHLHEQYEYDAAGRKVKVVQIFNDKLRVETTYEYDDAGNVTRELSKDSNGNVEDVQYEYNSKGELVKRVFNITGYETVHETYIYDSVGNVVEQERDPSYYYGVAHTTYKFTYRK